MSYTRRIRKGGAGFLNTIGEAIGIKKKSPFTGPLVTTNETNILKKIKRLEEGIPAVKSLGNFEGFNTANAIQAMEKELSTLKKQVANLRGENTMTYTNNPGYAHRGGKRKSRKQKRRSRTRKHH
jgi:hypothetical protein